MFINTLNNKVIPLLFIASLSLFLNACATTTVEEAKKVDAPASSSDEQPLSQSTSTDTAKLELKRKVAIGRFSPDGIKNNSLLGTNSTITLGKSLSDKLNSSLVRTENFIVLQRSDLQILEVESKISNKDLNLVGVDTLLFGSVTEYGRKTTGKSGFLSKSKKQTVEAKVEINLVDAQTGHMYHSVSGSGTASTETSAIAGMGATAGFDQTLGDKAINNAINDAINSMLDTLLARKWETGIIAIEGDLVYIAGGQSQGLWKGMKLTVNMPGRKVTSPQTGFIMELPGKEIANLEVIDFFGDSEESEGAVCIVVNGDIQDEKLSKLVVTYEE